MTSSNDQPLSRRAARLAQQNAHGADERHDGENPVEPAVPSPASFGASRPSAADAIDYRTEVRPRVPRYEPSTPASLDSVPDLPSSGPIAPPFAPPTAPAPGREVRSRDFRPPTERGAPPTFSVQQPDDAELDYRTQGGPVSAAFSAPAFSAPSFSAPAMSAPVSSAPEHSAAVHSAPLAPSPSPSAPVVDPAYDALDSSGAPGLAMPEYTMTRRELRALREAQSGGASAVDADAEADAPAAPVADDPAAPVDDERDAGVAPSEPVSALDEAAPGIPAAAEVGLDPFDALLSAPRLDEEPSSAPAALVEPESESEEPAPLHLWQPTSSGSAAPAPLIEPAPPIPGDVAAPAESAATGSHWSAGFNEPADDPFENTFSRSVGSASLSTNALVLPEMPLGSLAGPVPGTGEIIITGMVDVPSSIASTGAVPSVHDSPDLDDLVDAGDREFVSTDSAPVSAINAVSSHTATRNVIAGRRPRGAMLTTVLIVSTVVMAIAAVTIFVVAAANGLF